MMRSIFSVGSAVVLSLVFSNCTVFSEPVALRNYPELAELANQAERSVQDVEQIVAKMETVATEEELVSHFPAFIQHNDLALSAIKALLSCIERSLEVVNKDDSSDIQELYDLNEFNEKVGSLLKRIQAARDSLRRLQKTKRSIA